MDYFHDVYVGLLTIINMLKGKTDQKRKLILLDTYITLYQIPKNEKYYLI